MKRLLLIFLILLGSIYLGIRLQQDPGYLLIAFHHWTIETTFWVALMGLLLLFVTFNGLLFLLRRLFLAPSSFKAWHTKRLTRKARANTQLGLIEFSEGHWLEAKQHLIKALPNTDTPLLNYLTAARAAQEMGDSIGRDHYLREAQQSMPDAKIAVELTQAQLQLANQQWEQALATLKHLQDLAPHHPYVLKLLMHLYEDMNDWPQLITLLPELKRNRILSDSAYLLVQQQAYVRALSLLIRQKEAAALTTFMTQLPRSLKHDQAILTTYCHYLLSEHQDEEAEPLLRRCLQKHYHDDLIMLYGQINPHTARLAFAESLITKHSHSAPLFLCLARLSRTNQLWGKAKQYFEQSIAFGATPTAYYELGTLLEERLDPLGAANRYRQGLQLALAGSLHNKTFPA